MKIKKFDYSDLEVRKAIRENYDIEISAIHTHNLNTLMAIKDYDTVHLTLDEAKQVVGQLTTMISTIEESESSINSDAIKELEELLKEIEKEIDNE